MKTTWTPRSIYLYVVCLVTLIMMIVSTVNLVRAVTEFVYPQPRPYSTAIKAPGEPTLDAEAEAKMMAEQREIDAQWSRRQAVISIVGGAALLLVAAPLYRYHWGQVRHERDGEQS